MFYYLKQKINFYFHKPISKKIACKNDGFTLIEIMVTVLIIGILSGITIASTGSVRSGRSIGLGAEQLVSDIRNVQNLSLAGGLAPHNVAGTEVMKPPCAFGISFDSITRYKIVYVAQDDSDENRCGENSLDDIIPDNMRDLPRGITDVQDVDVGLSYSVKRGGGFTDLLLFKLPNGDKHSQETDNQVEVTFIHRSSDHSRTVKIKKDGQIEY